MKRLFILLAAVMMAVSVMGQQSLPRTYCGCTLGETVYDNLFDRNLHLPESARFPEGLSYQKEACIYVGDFIVEGHHFSIMTLSFYKDTLYRIEFRDEEINNDIMELNRTFVREYNTKYNSLKEWLPYNSIDEDLFVSCSKTDGTLGVSIIGTTNSLHFNISQERLADESLQAAQKSILASDEKNRVTGIAGIRFGETRKNTINAFKQRGTLLDNENNITSFYNVNFGGSSYNNATLCFQYDSKRREMVFVAAKFEKNFYEWKKEEAKMMYESIVSQYKEKYTNCIVLKDEEDFKGIVCGTAEEDYLDGKMPPILISFELGISRGGEKFYYITVSYFEYRMNNAANDDI